MLRFLKLMLFISLVILAQTSCVLQSYVGGPEMEPIAPLQGYGTLGKLPFREGWYGMYFQEDKVGYSHFKIEPSGRNFKISSDSVMKLTALKKTSQVLTKERVIVRPDLTLLSFESLVRMNDKELRMIGRAEGNRFLLEMSTEGETLNRECPVSGQVYHTSAISLMPSLKGLKEGQTLSFNVFNPEKQGLDEVKQKISRVKGEAGLKNAVWKVKNDYGLSVVSSWLDRQGLTVLEKALDGSLVTKLEDEAAAQEFLKKKAPKTDLVLDFSLIRVERPIPHPEKTRYLKIKISGIKASLIPSDHRQQVIKPKKASEDDAFELTVRCEDTKATDTSQEKAPPNEEKYLEANMAVQSDKEEIKEQAGKIAGTASTDAEKIAKLVDWTARNIKNTMDDSFTSLSVLKDRKGECQAHSILYAAFARALKIPTRIVTGLVYIQDVGFLYHAWAESYAGKWLAVDPTFNQVPADATHIKIATGDSMDEVASLLKVMGKIKIDVLDFKEAARAATEVRTSLGRRAPTSMEGNRAATRNTDGNRTGLIRRVLKRGAPVDIIASRVAY